VQTPGRVAVPNSDQLQKLIQLLGQSKKNNTNASKSGRENVENIEPMSSDSRAAASSPFHTKSLLLSKLGNSNFLSKKLGGFFTSRHSVFAPSPNVLKPSVLGNPKFQENLSNI